MTSSITAEVVNVLPILIIDKEGSIGIALYAKLKDHLQTVLVGGKEPTEAKNLLFLPFGKELPAIPHDPYSHIFFIPSSVKELEELLPQLITKAEADSAKILLLIPQKIQSQVSSKYHLLASKIITIIVLGDLFGKIKRNVQEDKVEEMLLKAKEQGRLHLPNMGLNALYPIAFSDMIREVLRVAFALPNTKKIYFAGKKEFVTELMLAHSLQKINPLLRIDFYESSQEKNREFPLNASALLPENYSVIEEIESYYKSLPESANANFYGEDKKGHIIETKKSLFTLKINIKRFSLLLAIFIVSILLLPIVVLAITGGGSYAAIKWTVADLEKGNIPQSESNAQLAQNLLSAAQKAQTIVSLEMGVLHQQKIVDIFAEKIQTGKQIASSLFLGATTIQDVKDILKGQKKISAEDLAKVINNGKEVVLQLEKVKGEGALSAKDEEKFSQIVSFAPFFNVLDSIPNLVGMQQQKTYLVLFQNNTELRPGGGFIGSYGLLTLNHASVINFTIHDVYDADGQLKGHIEPPFAIRRYLPSVHLYLRDSNFDVDFTKNAYMAAFLLQQETGQQVDGVIGIDLSFVQNLVKGLGSVYVPDYNETVTAQNMFLLTENHAEKNFFPGSTQKKDFLRSLFIAIQNKLSEKNSIGITFINQLIESIQQKHMLFAFSNASTQELFTANNLSSSLWDARKNEENTVNDFLGINEANLGVDKVNYWITREVSQSVNIADSGVVSGSVTLKIANTSKGTWPAGEYKSYLRFILPEGAALKKIIINGQEQVIVPAVTDFLVYEKKGFIPPVGLEVEKTEENGKTLYGFLVITNPLTTRSITIDYDYAQKIDTSKPVFGYSFAYFKQPGTDSYPFTFSLTYPPSFKLLSGPSFITTSETNANFLTTMAKDTSFIMKFSKK